MRRLVEMDWGDFDVLAPRSVTARELFRRWNAKNMLWWDSAMGG